MESCQNLINKFNVSEKNIKNENFAVAFTESYFFNQPLICTIKMLYTSPLAPLRDIQSKMVFFPENTGPFLFHWSILSRYVGQINFHLPNHSDNKTSH